MLAIPRRIRGVSHPLVNDLYLKTEQTDATHKQNVLIIETADNSDHDDSNMDSSLLELLTDLDSLKSRVEEKIGAFDRIDIKSPVSKYSDTYMHKA